MIGTKSLNYHRTKGKTPFYAKELERFKLKIVDPMDAAWLRLTDSERAQFDFEVFPVKW